MNTKNIIENLKINGFKNAGQLVFSDNEKEELSILSKNAFKLIKDTNTQNNYHKDYLKASDGFHGMMHVPQQNIRIAKLINKVVSNVKVCEILEAVLGSEYKIWQVDYRIAIPGDVGLSLHQDSYGELTISINLSNNNTGKGCTTFLAGSHLLKKNIIRCPLFITKLLSSLLTPLNSKKGDIAFFFNHTWHGRAPNKTNNSYDAILISFYPSGSSFGSDRDWSTKFIKENNNLRISQLINRSIGVIKTENGKYKVLSNSKNKNIPFVLKLHHKEVARNGAGGLKLIVTVFLFQFLNVFSKPFIFILKKIIKKY
jgi:putative 2OG-Fe(II) oxygenase